MGKLYQITGIVFFIISGILYTLERFANWIANGLSSQGSAVFSGNGSLSEPWVGVTDNIFVVIFGVIGIVIFIYGLVIRTK